MPICGIIITVSIVLPFRGAPPPLDGPVKVARCTRSRGVARPACMGSRGSSLRDRSRPRAADLAGTDPPRVRLRRKEEERGILRIRRRIKRRVGVQERIHHRHGVRIGVHTRSPRMRSSIRRPPSLQRTAPPPAVPGHPPPTPTIRALAIRPTVLPVASSPHLLRVQAARPRIPHCPGARVVLKKHLCLITHRPEHTASSILSTPMYPRATDTTGRDPTCPRSLIYVKCGSFRAYPVSL